MDANILAFDTSLPHCAAAFLCDVSIYKMTEDIARGQAERLVPLLEAVLGHSNADWDSLDLIAVGTGPGNFTGIRIAVSAARGLGLGLGIPVMGVSMFDTARWHFGVGEGPSEIVSLPAPRGQAYVQHFRYGKPTAPPSIIHPDNLPNDLQYPLNTVVIGHEAEKLCVAGRGSHWQEGSVDNVAENIARAADRRWDYGKWEPDPAAPLYVRAADAAPPRDAPPTILP
ncbi:MAG: tRNA (adenosine(37)-N6)-threonylcarbamoyltransferase complex dimerization subunit type 1 TsaB [Yoonia sp.]|nr:tRNA (adenosine(37)-N6)-threonylcarbamoyltransferase complex dimerization subunit type 1 TsaB [Yoonia sp.]